MLSPEAGKNQQRIWVSIDWTKVPKGSKSSGKIIFKDGLHEFSVDVHVRNLNQQELRGYKGFIENNGFLSIHAGNFSRQSNVKMKNWKKINEPGYTGKVLQVFPINVNEKTSLDTSNIKHNNAVVEYDFYSFTAAAPEITIFSLPTHPLNNNFSMRYAISVDNGPMHVVDFKTYGRSEAWKQNVLSNRAQRKIKMQYLNKGKHTLKIYAIDPGVTVDEIRIDLGGLKKAYGVIEETRLGN